MTPNPLATVPAALRSTVRAYVNSENAADIEHARELCRAYGVDYAAARAWVLREMTEYEVRRVARDDEPGRAPGARRCDEPRH